MLADPHSNTIDSRVAILSTFQLLVMVPIEFMSRTIRTELVRRAVNADIFYSSGVDTQDLTSAITVVRVFIHNVSVHIGSIDQPASTVVLSDPG